MGKEVERALERVARIEDVAIIAAMPDLHFANAVCVGAVVATRTMIFPDAVGGDIGCGMAALRFENYQGELADPAVASKLFQLLKEHVPISKHSSRVAILPEDLLASKLSAPVLEAKKHSVGRVQFASLGRGNHFVEFQRDEEGELWLMVHSGSRGIGQGIREFHGGGKGALRGIIAESDDGQAYLRDMNWALHYARESRRQMVQEVTQCVEECMGLRPCWPSYFDCQHNFVREEEYEDEPYWVHRKGAISARSGELGIIPGSMGSASYHVSGRGNTESLCSASHGAGRCKSRTEAFGSTSTERLVREMKGVWFDRRIANRLRDEAPSAYKDISVVMRAQRELVRIVRKLQPILVYKGG